MPQFYNNRDTYLLTHLENAYTDEASPYGRVMNIQTNASAPFPKFTSSFSKFGSYSLGVTGGAGHAAVWWQGYNGSNYEADIDKEKRFHIDFWLYMTAVTGNTKIITVQTLFASSPPPYSPFIQIITGGSGSDIAAQLINTNNDNYSSSAYAISAGVFFHVALERDSDTTVKFYLGGTLKETITVNADYYFTQPLVTYTTYGIRVGCQAASSTNVNSFYIDELRCSLGSKYSGNFTPPTAAYDA